MSSFGAGLGSLIGGGLASADLSAANDAVGGELSGFGQAIEPYNSFGTSLLTPASTAISGETADVPQFGQFMQNFQASPGAKYTEQQQEEAQNNSAASTGNLLSGANERALSTIANNISSTDINSQYANTLQGNQQQFGQLQSIIGNLFQGIGVGQTATGQNAGVITGTQAAQANIAASQAKADQAKGSGIGSMFSGIGSLASMF